MRAVVQRVTRASVKVNNQIKSTIGKGLMILLGVETTDDKNDIEWLCKKISQLRIFDDEYGVMNFSVKETDGEVLVISQFTLHAKTRKGNRPSYIHAARAEVALHLYHHFIDHLSQILNKPVLSGEFGAYMQVNLVNNGPVTLIIDTKNKE